MMSVALLAWALPTAVLTLWLLGIFRAQLATDRLVILAFHRFVRTDSPDATHSDSEPAWVTEEANFEEQVAWLAREGFTAIDLDGLAAIRSGQSPRPARSVIFTFDDGYASVADIAAPILMRYGMTGTIFALLDPDAHSRDLIRGKDRFLQPEELRALADVGWSIQSHTVTHAILTELPDAQLDWELRESAFCLHQITGKAVRHLCLPRGGVSNRVIECARRLGYRTICGLGKGTARFSSDPLQLPRLSPLRHQGGAALRWMLTPVGATIEIALARLKVVPTRLLGARHGYRLRSWLYRSPLRAVFGPRHVKRTALALVAVWFVLGIWTLAHVGAAGCP